MSRKIRLVSPPFPCGVSWLVNVLLELNIKCSYVSYKDDTHWIEENGCSRITETAKSHLAWHLPILHEQDEFHFKDDIEVIWGHDLEIDAPTPSKTILFLRDPRDSIISHYHRHYTSLNLDDYLRRRDIFPDHFSNLFGVTHQETWALYALIWSTIVPHSDLSVIRFEDCKNTPLDTVRKVLRFLNVTRERGALKSAIENSSTEKAHNAMQQMQTSTGQKWATVRKGTALEWTKADDKSFLKHFNGMVAEAMPYFGYTADGRLTSRSLMLPKTLTWQAKLFLAKRSLKRMGQLISDIFSSPCPHRIDKARRKWSSQEDILSLTLEWLETLFPIDSQTPRKTKMLLMHTILGLLLRNRHNGSIALAAKESVNRPQIKMTSSHLLKNNEGKVLLALKDDGSVGLGTCNPTLNGDGLVMHLHDESSAAVAAIHLTSSVTGGAQDQGVILGTWNDSTVYLWSYDPQTIRVGTSNNESMRIDPDGILRINNAAGPAQVNILSNHQKGTQAPALLLNNNHSCFLDSLLQLTTKRTAGSDFNFIEGKTDAGEETVYSVGGDGQIFTKTGLQTQGSSYGEFFEYGNVNQIKPGTTIMLTDGKAMPASPNTSSDDIIGVAWPQSPSLPPALIGNSPASLAQKPTNANHQYCLVSLLGKALVNKGQPVGTNWIKLDENSPEDDWWLLR